MNLNDEFMNLVSLIGTHQSGKGRLAFLQKWNIFDQNDKEIEIIVEEEWWAWWWWWYPIWNWISIFISNMPLRVEFCWKSDFDRRHKALTAVLGFPQRLNSSRNSSGNNKSDISKTTCAHTSDSYHSSMLYLLDITDIAFSYYVKVRCALKINLKSGKS